MADNFGLKIGVEGEREFKNALRDINQSFKAVSYTHLAADEGDTVEIKIGEDGKLYAPTYPTDATESRCV